MITAKKIELIVQTNAVHALYREDGKWYHHLRYFPGVLFDNNGYIVFPSQESYNNSLYLHHGEDINIPNGISAIPGYQTFTEDEKEAIVNLI